MQDMSTLTAVLGYSRTRTRQASSRPQHAIMMYDLLAGVPQILQREPILANAFCCCFQVSPSCHCSNDPTSSANKDMDELQIFKLFRHRHTHTHTSNFDSSNSFLPMFASYSSIPPMCHSHPIRSSTSPLSQYSLFTSSTYSVRTLLWS